MVTGDSEHYGETKFQGQDIVLIVCKSKIIGLVDGAIDAQTRRIFVSHRSNKLCLRKEMLISHLAEKYRNVCLRQVPSKSRVTLLVLEDFLEDSQR